MDDEGQAMEIILASLPSSSSRNTTDGSNTNHTTSTAAEKQEQDAMRDDDNDNNNNDNEPNLIQTDSMDGHVDPVSCQLLLQQDFDDDDDEWLLLDDQQQQLPSSQLQQPSPSPYYCASGRMTQTLDMQTNFYKQRQQQQQQDHEQPSPPAPRSHAPVHNRVQRPQAQRLQLFAVPTRSYEDE